MLVLGFLDWQHERDVGFMIIRKHHQVTTRHPKGSILLSTMQVAATLFLKVRLGGEQTYVGVRDVKRPCSNRLNAIVDVKDSPFNKPCASDRSGVVETTQVR